MPTDPLQRLRDLALEAPDLDSQDGQSWVAEVTELLSQLDRPNEAHDLGRYADGSHPEADEGELSEPQRRARVNEIVERAVTAHETRRDDRPQLTELSKHEKMAGQRGMPRWYQSRLDHRRVPDSRCRDRGSDRGEAAHKRQRT